MNEINVTQQHISDNDFIVGDSANPWVWCIEFKVIQGGVT